MPFGRDKKINPIPVSFCWGAFFSFHDISLALEIDVNDKFERCIKMNYSEECCFTRDDANNAFIQNENLKKIIKIMFVFLHIKVRLFIT